MRIYNIYGTRIDRYGYYYQLSLSLSAIIVIIVTSLKTVTHAAAREIKTRRDAGEIPPMTARRHHRASDCL